MQPANHMRNSVLFLWRHPFSLLLLPLPNFKHERGVPNDMRLTAGAAGMHGQCPHDDRCVCSVRRS